VGQEQAFLEVVVAEHARAGLGFAQQHGLVAQVEQVDGLDAGQAMVRLRDEHVGMRREGLGHQGELARRAPHDREVDLVASQVTQQAAAVAGQEAQLDLGMIEAEPGEQARHEVLRGADHADGDAAAAQALEVVHRLLGIVHLAQHARGVLVEAQARLGQLQALADAVEQRQFQRQLELLDLHRDRRLAQVQFLARAHEAALARHRAEDLQLPERDAAQHK